MNIPDTCKDCIYLKLYILKDNTREATCMLTHPFNLAAGCPNRKTDYKDYL